MLTIFACPKPFTNPHIAIIQRNAITSWILLQPRPEIILFGNEHGTAEICQELGLRYVPQVARNEYGTPLLNDVFDKAQRLAIYDLMCYVNADIILMSDFSQAIYQTVKWVSRHGKNFLLTGQRWGIQLSEILDFSRDHYEEYLRHCVLKRNDLHSERAIDYFVFPRGLFRNTPPFAVGRFSWDNWLIWDALSSKVHVIDATKVVMLIHQNHDYSHMGGLESISMGEEARRNDELAGCGAKCKTIFDANYILTPQGVKSAWLRKKKILAKQVLYKWLVYRTSRFRYSLGLRRATLTRWKERLVRESMRTAHK